MIAPIVTAAVFAALGAADEEDMRLRLRNVVAGAFPYAQDICACALDAA